MNEEMLKNMEKYMIAVQKAVASAFKRNDRKFEESYKRAQEEIARGIRQTQGDPV